MNPGTPYRLTLAEIAATAAAKLTCVVFERLRLTLAEIAATAALTYECQDSRTRTASRWLKSRRLRLGLLEPGGDPSARLTLAEIAATAAAASLPT